MNEISKNIVNDMVCCPMCESRSVVTQTELERFEYGSGKNKAELSVYVPVNKCHNCGFEFVGEKADDLRHDAICSHLKLLTPGRIRELRMRLGKSQASFAELTHLGLASIQRWEQRQVLQSESSDLYLRLLEFPENIERIERWNRGESIGLKQDVRENRFNGLGLNANAVDSLVPASRTFTLNRKVG